jgi:hypothetical protein
MSLIEAVVGTVIAIIVVTGLAHSFGIGRGLIFRYEVARVALAAAQDRMERLSTLPPSADSLKITSGDCTTYGPLPFNARGEESGTESWTVCWYDDPIDGTAPIDPLPHDLKQVTVRVMWNSTGVTDTVQLVRFFTR